MALVSLLLVIITAAFGHVFYNAAIPAGTALLETLVVLAVGASAFCALGFAISVVIPDSDASLPIVNAVIPPLLFLSGVFIPLIDAPAWMMWVGRVFPISHFLAGTQAGFLGGAFSWTDVLVLGVWAALWLRSASSGGNLERIDASS